DNGSRLYYANLTALAPGSKAFKGAEAIAVSHTDNLTGAEGGDNSAWSAPALASKQSGAKFSDKEQIWADNAATSPYFGNAYGGSTWSRPRTIASTYDTCGYVEASIGRCVEDGVGGARSDLSPAPSVDIANAAPSGSNASNRIVMTWVDGQTLNGEKVMLSTST